MKSYLALPLILSTSLASLSSADSIRGLGDATTTDEALTKSTVDRLPWLHYVTLIWFAMDLLELDGGGGTEGSKRDGEDEGEGKEEMK